MASLEAKMKECMKPHALLHALLGIGLGLILVSFMPALKENAFMFGLLVAVVAIVGDMMVNKG